MFRYNETLFMYEMSQKITAHVLHLCAGGKIEFLSARTVANPIAIGFINKNSLLHHRST
jgi:hypothetical protein